MLIKFECPICGYNTAKIKYKLKHNVFHCKNCGVFFRKENSNISSPVFYENDLFTYEKAFKNLRLKDFNIIIPKIKELLPSSNLKGLEVGSAHGWFIQEAEKNDIKMIGIEPQDLYKNDNIYKGYFYKDLPPNEKDFDFIIFNHSLEHIKDIQGTIEDCYKRLKNNGILVINIPISNGFFYKISQFLYILGLKDFLNRMWVFDFDCCHEFYYNKKSLNYLMKHKSFSFINKENMHSVDTSTLKERIMMDETHKSKKVFASIISIIIKIFYPVINILFPNDWQCFFYRKD